MTKRFNMALFLNGILTGSMATRQRHLRQALIMQAAIQQRWNRDNPWTWKHKHIRWFLTYYIKKQAQSTRYYYRLTALLILQRVKGLPNTAKPLNRSISIQPDGIREGKPGKSHERTRESSERVRGLCTRL